MSCPLQSVFDCSVRFEFVIQEIHCIPMMYTVEKAMIMSRNFFSWGHENLRKGGYVRSEYVYIDLARKAHALTALLFMIIFML